MMKSKLLRIRDKLRLGRPKRLREDRNSLKEPSKKVMFLQ